MALEALEAWSQLVTLRAVTGSSRAVLHDVQILNLKMWPRLAMPHSTSSEFAYSETSKTVEFRVTLGKKKAPPKLKKLLDGLDRSVKTMLGSDFTVIVKANGREMYRSAGREKLVAAEAAGFKAAVANAQYGGVTRAPLPQEPIDDGTPNRQKLKTS